MRCLRPAAGHDTRKSACCLRVGIELSSHLLRHERHRLDHRRCGRDRAVGRHAVARNPLPVALEPLPSPLAVAVGSVGHGYESRRYAKCFTSTRIWASSAGLRFRRFHLGSEIILRLTFIRRRYRCGFTRRLKDVVVARLEAASSPANGRGSSPAPTPPHPHSSHLALSPIACPAAANL